MANKLKFILMLIIVISAGLLWLFLFQKGLINKESFQKEKFAFKEISVDGDIVDIISPSTIVLALGRFGEQTIKINENIELVRFTGVVCFVAPCPESYEPISFDNLKKGRRVKIDGEWLSVLSKLKVRRIIYY